VGFGTGGYLTIQSGGQSRGFALRLPDNYDNSKPYWLIFGFHWNGGNSAQVDNGGTSGYDWSYYGLQKASKNGAIFVAPDGLGAGWANSGGRDLTFTDDMVKLGEDNYCVDTTHIISTGFSYGGGMSYEIACARAKVFRAVAIFEGAQLSGCDGGNDPIAYWQMVGTADTTCTEAMATPLRDKFVKNNRLRLDCNERQRSGRAVRELLRPVRAQLPSVRAWRRVKLCACESPVCSRGRPARCRWPRSRLARERVAIAIVRLPARHLRRNECRPSPR
jgi:poly(3-hydroxybutyrate) depolymerase